MLRNKKSSELRARIGLGLPVFLFLALAFCSAFGSGSGSGGIVVSRVSLNCTDLEGSSSGSSSSSVVPVASQVYQNGALQISGTQSTMEGVRGTMSAQGQSAVVVEGESSVTTTGLTYELLIPVGLAGNLDYQFKQGPLALCPTGSGGIVVLCTQSSSSSTSVGNSSFNFNIQSILANPWVPTTLIFINSSFDKAVSMTLVSDGVNLKINSSYFSGDLSGLSIPNQ